MRELTQGDIFSGGGGWSLGAQMAGFRPIWAVEYVRAIAEVYEMNLGYHVRVAKVQDVDPHKLEPVDLRCASPVCMNFSAAKSDGIEDADDIASAEAVCRFL